MIPIRPGLLPNQSKKQRSYPQFCGDNFLLNSDDCDAALEQITCYDIDGLCVTVIVLSMLQGPLSDTKAQKSAPAGVFVVGSGRCGSTLVSDMLNTRADLLSVSEFFITFISRSFIYKKMDAASFWKLLSEPSPSVKKLLTPEHSPEFLYEFRQESLFTPENIPPIVGVMLPHITNDPDTLFLEIEEEVKSWSTAEVSTQYARLFNWLCARLKRRKWIERSGASLVIANSLVAKFPEAKFVHIYRDGRDVVMSMLNHPPTRYIASTWINTKRMGVDLLRKPFRLGECRLVAEVENHLSYFLNIEKRRDRPLSLRGLGEFWSEMIRVGLDDLSTLPDEQVLNLSYEELSANPNKALRQLMEFIDPGFCDEGWLAEMSKRVHQSDHRWQNLSRREQDELLGACEPGLRALGYTI